MAALELTYGDVAKEAAVPVVAGPLDDNHIVELETSPHLESELLEVPFDIADQLAPVHGFLHLGPLPDDVRVEGYAKDVLDTCPAVRRFTHCHARDPPSTRETAHHLQCMDHVPTWHLPLNLASQDLLDNLGDVGTDDVRLATDRAEHHAWPGDERGLAAGSQSAGNVPGVRSDQANVGRVDIECDGNSLVGLGCGLEPLECVGGDDVVEVITDASVRELLLGHPLDRICQGDHLEGGPA